jgi:starvation-inducible DNA-binding protein
MKTSQQKPLRSPVPFTSPSRLAADARGRIALSLNARLADGLDLHSQTKVAHWNVKGPHFTALHPHFDALATLLAGFTDELAERAVTLGGVAVGTARSVAAASTLPEYPASAVAGLDHVRALAERLEHFAQGLRESRAVADEERDIDTSDLLTGMLEEVEKQAWFLRASLEG